MEEWISNNQGTAWIMGIFILPILWYCIKFCISILQAIKISHLILKDNRTRLRGDDFWGKHYADRFIDIWNQKHLQESEKYYLNNFRCKDSYFTLQTIDKKLKKLKLIKLENENPTRIINIRNKMIYSLCKIYLIYFVGDKKDAYKELETK